MTAKPIAFVSGPYTAPTHEGIKVNVTAAAEVARELWRLGFAVVCPHTNSAHFDDSASYDDFLAGYLAILRRCDVVVMLPGWAVSRGSILEHALADELYIPVYSWPDGADGLWRFAREFRP